MKVGFTGTQEGMQEDQLLNFINLIVGFEIPEFHHGDCIGSDEQAHNLIRQYTDAKIYIHPPINPKSRAFCQGDTIYEEKAYLDRNRDIVTSTEMLIATPKGTEKEERRSGTWMTVRYARKLKRPVWIVYPNGDVAGEGDFKQLFEGPMGHMLLQSD